MAGLRLELRVIEIVDRVRNGHPNEDDLVELKTTWPDPPHHAARRLAASANAARGDQVLWIIGVDEKTGKVATPPAREVSGWLAQLAKRFNEAHMPPLVEHRVVQIDPGHDVVALAFDSSGIPYVVNNPDFGQTKTKISLEVPWREGTRTRSATRRDIVRLLVPIQHLPEVDLVNATAWIRTEFVGSDVKDKKPRYEWGCSIHLYITPPPESTIVLPRNQRSGRIVYQGRTFEFDSVGIEAPYSLARATGLSGPRSMMENFASEVVIHGPCTAYVSGHAKADPWNLTKDPIQLSVRMRPSYAASDIAVDAQLPYSTDKQGFLGYWGTPTDV